MRSAAIKGDWTEATLGELATWSSGKNLSANKRDGAGAHPILGANGIIGRTNEVLLDCDLITVGRVGACGETHQSAGPVWVSDNALIAIPNSRVVIDYLYHVLSVFDYKTITSGTTQPLITQNKLKNQVVQLPPLAEQKRIVDVIGAVDAYIAGLQQQAVNAWTARNAVLQELLSAGGQDWSETTLGEITNINPEDTARIRPHEEITYIDLSSVSSKGGVSDELFRGPYSGAPGRARRIVRAQDVLVSTVRPYLKGFAVVPKHLDGSIASTGFSVLRAKTGYSLPGYIWAVVGTARFVEDLIDKATGSSYPAVRPSDIASHLVNLPPLAEQQRIVETVTAMDDVVSSTEQAVRVTQELRSGLLSTLLSGEHEIPATYDCLLGAA
jgi:type I restriction enzyme S subunit